MDHFKKYQGTQILLQINGSFEKVRDYCICSEVTNLARLKEKKFA